MPASTENPKAHRAAVIAEYLAEFRRVNGREAEIVCIESRFIRIMTDEAMPANKYTIGELTAAIGRLKARPDFSVKEADAPVFSLDDIPEYDARTDSLTDQLRDLHAVAVRLGMTEAAAFIQRSNSAPHTAPHGAH